MHGAAQALVEAGGAGEDLGQRAVEHVVDGQLLDAAAVGELLDDAQRRAVHVALHDRGQRVVAQLLDGREALGQDLAVAAMRAEDEVVGRQVVGLSDHRRLLADGEMGRATMVVFDALVDALFLDAVEHGLELANDDHVAIDAAQILRPVLGDLRRRVGDIDVDGNLRRGQDRGFSDFGWVDCD